MRSDKGALSGRSSHFTDHNDSVLDSTALGKRAEHACLPAMPRLRPWPLDREARGLVSAQLGATSTGGKEDALLVVRDGLLTLHLLTLDLEEHGNTHASWSRCQSSKCSSRSGLGTLTHWACRSRANQTQT